MSSESLLARFQAREDHLLGSRMSAALEWGAPNPGMPRITALTWSGVIMRVHSN
jgi:hypothetical protein